MLMHTTFSSYVAFHQNLSLLLSQKVWKWNNLKRAKFCRTHSASYQTLPRFVISHLLSSASSFVARLQTYCCRHKEMKNCGKCVGPFAPFFSTPLPPPSLPPSSLPRFLGFRFRLLLFTRVVGCILYCIPSISLHPVSCKKKRTTYYNIKISWIMIYCLTQP